MNFTDAITAVFKEGDKITRATWANRSVYVSLEEGLLCTTWDSISSSVDGLHHPWTISEADFFAHDWEVLSDA